MRRPIIRTLAPLAVLALVVGACSDDDDDSGGDAEPTLPGASAVPGETSADTSADSVTGGTAAGTTAGSAASTTPDTAEEVQTPGDSILDSVLDSRLVRCGVRDDLAGFATLDDAGEYVGFDADFCRVIAAAVLGDATAVEFVPIETEARFTALQAGEIDVLVRNTTWTASRDGTEGANFLHPTFYDGQQMMVAADAGSPASMTWTVLSSASPPARRQRATSPPSSPVATSPSRCSRSRASTSSRKRSTPAGATGGRATAASWPAPGRLPRPGPTRS